MKFGESKWKKKYGKSNVRENMREMEGLLMEQFGH